MTRLEPYAKYKDTEVDWLGRIPSHWGVVPLKRRATTGAGAGFPHEFQGVPEGEIPFYKVNSLAKAGKDGVIDFVDESISRDTALRLRAKIYPAGSAVLAKIGAALLLGRIRTLGIDACIDNNMMSIQADEGTDPRFLYYALALIRFDLLVNPGAVPSTSEGAVAELKLAFPGREEQQRIAAFLDRETAQIDDLIGKQERLIELLAEKRHAVITHAVAKGLDPEAPTKPSGIPWLGDIHASWPVRPLKAAGNINLGKMIQPNAKTETDFEAPYLRAANVQPGGVLALDDVKKMWFNDGELQSLDIRAGDVVVVEGGIGGFGRAAYVDRDLTGFGYQNSINRIRPTNWVDGRFLTYLLLIARHSGYIHAYCTGVSMPHLTAEKLAAVSVPLPDRVTQTKISDHLDLRLATLNTLADKAGAVIRILHERRSALVSAAVTGQIEVGSI